MIWERVPDFGTLVKDCKLLKTRSTIMRLIVVGCSGAIILLCTWLLVKNRFRNIGGIIDFDNDT